MFLRTTKVKRPDGKVDEYIRLVESDWNNGSPRHRVICNLGRKELLAPHAEALLRLLQGKEKTKAANPEATAVGAWDWGVMLVARHFWKQLELQEIIDSLAKNRGLGGELADRALALVTNRLCEPTSEHGMARWLETDFVCDRWGRRWFPEWREEGGSVCPAGGPGSGSKTASCDSGIGPWTSCWCSKSQSRRNCFCACGICFP
jgi:hypothetical protein